MKKAKLITAISLGAVVGLALALVVAYAKISLHGKLPPGTSVAGIDISVGAVILNGKTMRWEADALIPEVTSVQVVV